LTPSPSLEDIAAKVETLSSANPAYAEVVSWVGELLSETVRAAEDFELPPGVLPPASPEASAKGRSLLDPAQLGLDWVAARRLYERLVDMVASQKGGEEQAPALQKALAKDSGDPPGLFKAVLAADYKAMEAVAEEYGATPPVLALLLRLALRPQLVALAQAAGDRDDAQNWNFGHCPLCGSAPRLADLSGEGGRSLHCSLCETVWSYRRIQCPFCESTEQDDLAYLKAESEPALRVDVCSRCGQYVKTLDLREMGGSVIMVLDDAATWHLDLLVRKHLEGGEVGEA
jgi:FdhE protein